MWNTKKTPIQRERLNDVRTRDHLNTYPKYLGWNWQLTHTLETKGLKSHSYKCCYVQDEWFKSALWAHNNLEFGGVLRKRCLEVSWSLLLFYSIWIREPPQIRRVSVQQIFASVTGKIALKRPGAINSFWSNLNYQKNEKEKIRLHHTNPLFGPPPLT